MIQNIKAPISVITKYDHKRRSVSPVKVLWEGRQYHIIKIGLHHTYTDGRILYHVFSVASHNLFFKLVLNTQNLHWTLEEIADAEAD